MRVRTKHPHHITKPIFNMSFDELLWEADKVETTSEANGYPSRLKMAFTFNTMSRLRELRDAAIEEGHKVTEVFLHRQDGWALWHSSKRHIEGIDWQALTEQDITIHLTNATDVEQEVFDLIVGDTSLIRSMRDLETYTLLCKRLLGELADPDCMEDGESIMYFLDLDQGYSVKYEVHSDQNGYSYDTHHYCLALLIEQVEED